MTIEDGRPPEWMIALENKQKRQHKLAHDIGAGAPCLNCNDRCSGLDLHFWRKICRNCKCKKEVHDVKEENSFEQFEILFGDNLKGSDRVKNLSLNLKFKLGDIYGGKELSAKDANEPVKYDNDLTFDWIPTDVPVNLASEYLQQLPLEKLPITGSAGAMFRRQQLQKQIPLHDFKVNNCHDLTDEETVAFMEYLDNLKHHAVGKGQITKILPSPDVKPDKSFPKLPAFSTNLNSSPKPFKCFSDTKPALDEDLPPPPSELLYPTADLKTPSAFTPYKFLPKTDNVNNNVPFSTENFNYDKYVESSTPIAGLAAQYSEKLNMNEKDSQNNNWCTDDEKIRSRDAENSTPGDIIRKFNAQSAVGSPSNLEKSRVNRNPNQLNEDTPTLINRNLSPSKNVDGKFLRISNPEAFVAVSSYVASTPQVSNTLTGGAKSSRRSPKVHFGSTIVYSDDESGSDLDKQLVQASSTAVTSSQNELGMDCHHCKRTVLPGQVVVVAERAGVEVIWHPQCFVCVKCQELLVDLVYFFHRGEVYCGRHYAEVLKIPRCFACDELIFLKEYTVAENQTFHVKHFCCFECDEPLAGKQYVPKDDHPVCLPCYEAKYGKQCNFCEEIIRAGESRVGWKDLSWHATALCFKCVQCSKSLLGGKFVVKNNSPLCSKECVLKFNLSSDL